MPTSQAKPFDIPKQMVWEAYRRVAANKGAPGVDEVDLSEFEARLKDNLYKVWNRMSSGSYFPPPVRAAEIPKPHGGGTRVLGVPTVTVNLTDDQHERYGAWFAEAQRLRALLSDLEQLSLRIASRGEHFGSRKSR